jgi:hypothetical protein
MNRKRTGDARPRRRLARTTAVLAILVLTVFMAIALWPSKPRAVPRPERSSRDDRDPPGLAQKQSQPALVASLTHRPPAAQHAPDPPPVIDEISVEKPEVCSGEENLITVRAHTENGTDAFLHTVVDGNMGQSVPLRLWLDKSGRVQGNHTVTVFGRTNTPVTVPLPDYRVKDCQPARIVAVQQHVRANSWADFDFVADVIALPPRGGADSTKAAGGGFTATSYAWSFGDGSATTAAAPVVTHSYEDRAQETLYSYFTVGVEVRSKEGGSLKGRTTLPLINPGFESLARKGIVQLLISLEPRFPDLGADGRVLQRVRIRHTRPDPVTLESATVTKYFETGSGQTRPERIDPAKVLGTSVIPPGKEGTTATLSLDTVADPGVFSMTYRVAGKSREGLPVMGSFSVLRPPPRPTAENSQRVTDPAFTAKILAARAILGKDVVSDEDIWQLEREQRLPPTTSSARMPTPPQPPPSLGDPQVPSRGPPVPTSVTPPPAITAATGATSPAR